MFSKSEQFITRIKLQELRKQRGLILEAYNRLEEQIEAARDNAHQLELLYRGLRQINFAGKPLHPEVTNLEPILLGLENQAASSPDITAFWLDRLQKELDSGRLRSEIVFIFSALLEEWSKEGDNPIADQQASEIKARLLELITGQVTDPETSKLNTEFLKYLVGSSSAETKQQLQDIINTKLGKPIELYDLRTFLTKIKQDRYHAASTRRQAQEILQNEALLKEFGDALTIMLGELELWDWPTEGINVRANLTPSKWRLFLNEDLPTACLLEILGDRWQKIFESFFQQIFYEQFEELRKTTARLAPTTRLEQALELYRSSFGIKSSIYAQFDIWNPVVKIQESDIWEDPASIEDKVKSRIRLEELLTRWVNRDGNSVFGRRAKLEVAYRDLGEINGYGNGAQDTELDSMETALAQVNAELRLAQAAYTDRPFYILKADLKDYYPTLPHTLILELLALFGLNRTQLDFFQKYLRIAIKDGPSVRTVQCGVPNHRRLADLLGELVMLLLDQYVKSSANIQIIRLIDDICILAASEEEAVKAWQALEEFCQQTGLRLNREKCGAVCIGGSLPAALPNRPPVWSMLTLNGQGEWRVDQGRFENYMEQSRQQVLQAEAIVTKSEMFNNSLNYLVKALGLRVKLGASHRQSVNQALVYFQNSFFGAERGVAEEFRRLIRERFLDQGAVLQLPDGWLHWPITAGGMSLNQALVLAWSYTKTFNRHANPQVPDDRTNEWLRRQNHWYTYYNRLLNNLDPDGPEPNQVMETLVKDFIERGSEISVEGQFDLGTYWRWILYIYGPQILDRLGTFRYLFTNLVPAQLITSKFRQGFEKESESDNPI